MSFAAVNKLVDVTAREDFFAMQQLFPRDISDSPAVFKPTVPHDVVTFLHDLAR